ncbi:hypothetical protein KPH14_004261 [Odynerus spinipes]|uniref:Polyprenal reductase n=1 Tax=Odynerus spinipes TaxID=1348599 RepID=A0AAD9VV78_9HYME|nr:hypothetical protein KPH14_004261 [Odynerus spinipes]
MDVNFIRIIFILKSCFMILIGTLVVYAETYLPVSITRSFYYGKYAIKAQQPIIEKLEVPKRWFRHFYVFAAPASTCSFILFFYKYILDGTIPEIVYWLLDISFGTSRKALVSPECAFLAIALLTIHCWKRLYECCCVSIFSNKKMNISHYLVGFIHYIGTILSIMGESDGFVRDSTGPIVLHKLTLLHKACAIIFLWSTFQQLKSNFILSSLRKCGNKVVSEDYKVPHGGLFDYVSGPLQLTEILVYLMLSVILWQSSTFHYVTIWVVINQVNCALLTHKWYQKTFPNYPKKRTILIPYFY